MARILPGLTTGARSLTSEGACRAGGERLLKARPGGTPVPNERNHVGRHARDVSGDIDDAVADDRAETRSGASYIGDELHDRCLQQRGGRAAELAQVAGYVTRYRTRQQLL